MMGMIVEIESYRYNWQSQLILDVLIKYRNDSIRASNICMVPCTKTVSIQNARWGFRKTKGNEQWGEKGRTLESLKALHKTKEDRECLRIINITRRDFDIRTIVVKDEEWKALCGENKIFQDFLTGPYMKLMMIHRNKKVIRTMTMKKGKFFRSMSTRENDNLD